MNKINKVTALIMLVSAVVVLSINLVVLSHIQQTAEKSYIYTG